MRDILKTPNDRARKEGTKMEKKELIEALKKMDTASVSDAIDKLGIPCGLLGIQAVVEGRKICGEAFTVHYIPCGAEKET